MDLKFEELYISYKPKNAEEKKEHSEMFKQYSKLRDELNEQRLKMKALSNSNTNINGIIKVQSDTINNLTNRNQCLEAMNRQLQVELGEANMRITKMDNQIRDLDRNNLGLIDDLESKSEQIITARDRIQDLEIANMKLTHENMALVNQMKTMKTAFKEMDDYLHMLNRQLHETELKLTETLRYEPSKSANTNKQQLPSIRTAKEVGIDDLENEIVTNSNYSPQQFTSVRDELSQKFAEHSMIGVLSNLKWNTFDGDILCIIYKVKTCKEPNKKSSIFKFWKKKTLKEDCDSNVDFTKRYQVFAKDLVIKFSDPNFGGRKSEILKEISNVNYRSVNPKTSNKKIYCC